MTEHGAPLISLRWLKRGGLSDRGLCERLAPHPSFTWSMPSCASSSQAQRRCSSKGSSVDSPCALGESDVRGVVSVGMATPTESSDGLTTVRGVVETG